ncbi:hypothetical protein [Streptomyces sp. NPDC014733]|uniref:hypothetical protein n=1 Tax=Streptomyces sp. NPDC014733 TaxID=3364885 RepID=UPI0037030773
MTAGLTPAEADVVLGVALGMSVEAVATQTTLRAKTVRGMLASAKGKLGRREMTCAGAVERAYATGALPAPPPDPVRHQISVRLSPAQVALIRLLSQGVTAQDIAGAVTKPESEVEQDLRTLCEITGADSAAHLITRAVQLGVPYRHKLPRRPVPLSRRHVAL